MKIAICGHGRAGKDIAAWWFNDHTFLCYSGFSTSVAITPHAAKHLGISEEEAFARRHEDRMLWFELGNKLREHDPAFLARQTFQHGDIAVGIRDRSEMEAVLREGLVRHAIWIDRDVPVDPTLNYGKELCDIVVENHGTLEEFYAMLRAVAGVLGVLNEELTDSERKNISTKCLQSPEEVSILGSNA